jgi:hypothetical protein
VFEIIEAIYFKDIFIYPASLQATRADAKKTCIVKIFYKFRRATMPFPTPQGRRP